MANSVISVRIQTDTDILHAIQQGIVDSPKTFYTLFNRSLLPTIRRKVQHDLQAPVPAVHYPLDWQTPRQRRAYFATNGFHHGIPYKRTGGLLRAWKVIPTPLSDKGFGVTIMNDNPAAPFVIGNRQQRMHRRTGWRKVDKQVEDLNAYVQDAAIDAWYSVVNGIGKKLP
jgi:hypothetical protein